MPSARIDRKSTRLNSSPQIFPLSLHDALPILVFPMERDGMTGGALMEPMKVVQDVINDYLNAKRENRSEEHTSELQSPDLPSFPTRRSSDLSFPDGTRWHDGRGVDGAHEGRSGCHQRLSECQARE